MEEQGVEVADEEEGKEEEEGRAKVHAAGERVDEQKQARAEIVDLFARTGPPPQRAWPPVAAPPSSEVVLSLPELVGKRRARTSARSERIAVVQALLDAEAWAKEGNRIAAEDCVRAVVGDSSFVNAISEDVPRKLRALAYRLAAKACWKVRRRLRATDWLRYALKESGPQRFWDGNLTIPEGGLELKHFLLDLDKRGILGFDLESCNAVLRHLAEGGLSTQAEKWILGEMPKRRIEPDVVSYSTAIYACAIAGEVHQAERWLARMAEAGVAPNLLTFNCVIAACAKGRAPVAARRWLDHIVAANLVPNVVSYNTAISACARRGDVRQAEGILSQMRSAHVFPDRVSCNSMLAVLAQAGEPEKAESFLKQMVGCTAKPDTLSYNAVIQAQAGVRDVEGAEFWLERMGAARATPDVVTYTSVINVCAELGDYERAEHWLVAMREAQVHPTLASYRAVMKACARGKAASRADYWLSELLAAGVNPGVQAYNNVINAYARVGNTTMAEYWFRQMTGVSLQPDGYTYGALIAAYGRAGDFETSRMLFREMEAKGIKPDLILHSRLLNACAESDKGPEKKEVKETFKNLVGAGLVPDAVVVGTVAKALGDFAKDQLCKELGVQPTDVGGRVSKEQRAAIEARKQRRREARRLREQQEAETQRLLRERAAGQVHPLPVGEEDGSATPP